LCSSCARSRNLRLRDASDPVRLSRPAGLHGRDLPYPPGEVRFRHDGVAPVDALGHMPGQLHRHRARDARPLEVADRRATQVVNQPPRNPRSPASTTPRHVEVADRPSTPVKDPLATRSPGTASGCADARESGGIDIPPSPGGLVSVTCLHPFATGSLPVGIPPRSMCSLAPLAQHSYRQSRTADCYLRAPQ
jgi:hypothetical protein